MERMTDGDIADKYTANIKGFIESMHNLKLDHVTETVIKSCIDNAIFWAKLNDSIIRLQAIEKAEPL